MVILLCAQEATQFQWNPYKIAADDGILKTLTSVTQGATTDFRSKGILLLSALIWNDINMPLMEV